MKIGIICASDDELAPFLPHIDGCVTRKKAMLQFYEGTISGVKVVALFSGVCKVNAAIAAQILIDTFAVDAILNPGVAGGMDPRVQIFDTVISTEVCYHDVAEDVLTDFHPWMDSVFFQADKGLIALSKAAINSIGADGSVYWGRMATGEAFIQDEGRQAINHRFSPLSVDMESGSIAHVCYVNSIPFLSIRSITDTADHSGNAHFEENLVKASNIAAAITISLLSRLKQRH